ncbi:MAG: acid sphingomyelinase-like phosphodiesterase protein [Acidobacteria bacterium]|nr:acid sphingomyelinase-like phosphodiesterase protein [Acidobacteriota bacterium]
MIRQMLLVTITLFAAAAAAAQTQPPVAGHVAGHVPAQQFISISDLHFDPYYDPSLMAKLEATDVSGWSAVFASSAIKTPSAYGADTNDPLLQSFLADLRIRAAGARFVTITGDLLGHHFPQDFQYYSSDKSAQAYQSFVTKTVQYIASSIQAAVPNIPVFPVLGNNDADCGDYEITPNGWFLQVFAKAWSPAVKSPTFVKQFSPTGHYAVAAPMPDTLIVGVNSIFFSASYDNACGQEGTDYGKQELAWIGSQLAAAAKNRQRVWLLYHIPPGINVYSTTHGPGICPEPSLMWKAQYTAAFDALMVKYAATVPVSLAGHTHMDDFRLLATAARPYAFIHITPGVSPIFTNNPAYEAISYAPATSTLTDYTVFYLSLGAPQPAWTTEYTFTTAYQQPTYSPATVSAVSAAIAADPATRALYLRYYASSNPASTTITPQTWRGYWCGTGAQNASAFTACYCVAPPPTGTMGP